MTYPREYITDQQALTTIAIVLDQFDGNNIQGLVEVIEDILVSSGAGFFDDADRFRALRG